MFCAAICFVGCSLGGRKAAVGLGLARLVVSHTSLKHPMLTLIFSTQYGGGGDDFGGGDDGGGGD